MDVGDIPSSEYLCKEKDTKIQQGPITKAFGLSGRSTHSLQRRGCERGLLGRSPTDAPGACPEGRGCARRGLPRSARRCPARTVTPGRRRHPGESASAAGPPRWRAAGACRGAGPGLGRTPHQ